MPSTTSSGPGEGVHLPGEDVLEPVVVGDGGERGGVGRERDRARAAGGRGGSGPTSSAARCSASAALPPLPNVKRVPPARSAAVMRTAHDASTSTCAGGRGATCGARSASAARMAPVAVGGGVHRLRPGAAVIGRPPGRGRSRRRAHTWSTVMPVMQGCPSTGQSTARHPAHGNRVVDDLVPGAHRRPLLDRGAVAVERDHRGARLPRRGGWCRCRRRCGRPAAAIERGAPGRATSAPAALAPPAHASTGRRPRPDRRARPPRRARGRARRGAGRRAWPTGRSATASRPSACAGAMVTIGRPATPARRARHRAASSVGRSRTATSQGPSPSSAGIPARRRRSSRNRGLAGRPPDAASKPTIVADAGEAEEGAVAGGATGRLRSARARLTTASNRRDPDPAQHPGGVGAASGDPRPPGAPPRPAVPARRVAVAQPDGARGTGGRRRSGLRG